MTCIDILIMCMSSRENFFSATSCGVFCCFLHFISMYFFPSSHVLRITLNTFTVFAFAFLFRDVLVHCIMFAADLHDVDMGTQKKKKIVIVVGFFFCASHMPTRVWIVIVCKCVFLWLMRCSNLCTMGCLEFVFLFLFCLRMDVCLAHNLSAPGTADVNVAQAIASAPPGTFFFDQYVTPIRCVSLTCVLFFCHAWTIGIRRFYSTGQLTIFVFDRRYVLFLVWCDVCGFFNLCLCLFGNLKTFFTKIGAWHHY
jgi:hypothetical protein